MLQAVRGRATNANFWCYRQLLQRSKGSASVVDGNDVLRADLVGDAGSGGRRCFLLRVVEVSTCTLMVLCCACCLSWIFQWLGDVHVWLWMG